MLNETVALLSAWRPGMSSQELVLIAIEQGILGKATAKRARDMVVEQFAPRYLVDGSRPARYLKSMIEAGVGLSQLRQICLIYTARANQVLYDYICEVYWQRYQAGRTTIAKDDALAFLENAVIHGKLPARWSDALTSRVASYLGGCLSDFGLVEGGHRSKRKIMEFKIGPLTSLYLAHELHFSGYSDNGVVEHTDWRLFGLESLDVIRELQRVGNDHLIVQYSGELLKMSWKYQSMEEALHAITTTML